MAEAVKVIVRCRPMNEREERMNCEVALTVEPSISQIQLRKANKEQASPKMFTFDGVYYVHDTTQQIYEDICFPLVEGVLEGYNGTIFAYGQTGCGKSYTMAGVDEPSANRGIIPRAFEHIFDEVASSSDTKFLVRASYLEIYNEDVRDLLAKGKENVKRKLELHEHPERGVYVQGLSFHRVSNVSDLEAVMELGGNNRSVGATLMNVESSRSHSIFTIDIELLEKAEGGGESLRAGKLNLVDLAGSERQSKTGASGERLREATKINLSLSALGNVISALVDGKSKHIPYRDSKLTRLLQSSLGGNTKTLMVACVSPADNNYDETLSTLRYANRAKNIKNKPKINEDPKDALLREYQEEIKRLKELLEGKGSTTVVQSLAPEEDRSIQTKYEAEIAALQAQYSTEQKDKAKLELELKKLQENYDLTMASVEHRQPGDGASLEQSESKEEKSDDKILQEHEDALRRLEELQGEMIGGERADDHHLKQQLHERRLKAKVRMEQLQMASDMLEDDGVIETIFNSLTDEVYAKTMALEKTQRKLRYSHEEIADIQAEFELDRQDYLSTIRNQQKIIELHKQLLEKVVPCLRRDCNYYNIDKVKADCSWNEDGAQWDLPQLTISKTSLSPVNSKTSMNVRRSASTSTIPKNSNSLLKKQTSPSHAPSCDVQDEDRYFQSLQMREDQDYFRPKRALELLLKGSVDQHHSPGHSSSAAAAAVHGIATQDTGLPRRHTKLSSLPTNSISLSHQLMEGEDVMRSGERRLSTHKRHNLEPLRDKPRGQ